MRDIVDFENGQREVGQDPPPAESQPFNSSRRRLARVIFALSFLVLLIVVTASGAALLYNSDVILPGVRSLGLDLSGKSTADAAGLLQNEWRGRTITIGAEDAIQTVSPNEVGILLDAEATAQLAHAQGRSRDTLEGLLRAEDGVSISPVWTFDAEIAQALLLSLAWQIDVSAQNASAQIVDARVEIAGSVRGRALDVAGAIAALEEDAWSIFEGRNLRLTVMPVMPAIIDVNPVVTKGSQWMRAPVLVSLYDPIVDERLVWRVTPQIIGEWVSIGMDSDDPTRLNCALDQAAIEKFLITQAASLGPLRYVEVSEAVSALLDAITSDLRTVDLRVYHHEQQHIVKAGETLSSIADDYAIPYPWIQELNPALGDELFVDQVVRIPSPDVLLPLPVVENKRIVVSLSGQKVRVYEDGNLKWEWPASTGMASSPTAPGVFQIQTHEPEAYAANWNLWMPHFMGIYRPVPASDFMNGFHGYTTRDGQPLLWMRHLGKPVTYGCILVSTENAAMLYEWAEEGVVVEIRQ